MHNQEQQVYKWLVKSGSILLFRDGDKIHLELDKEASESCLLAQEDAEAVISIITSIAESIWHNPDYVKEPYQGRLYKTDNEIVYWDLGPTKLYVGFNLKEQTIAIN